MERDELERLIHQAWCSRSRGCENFPTTRDANIADAILAKYDLSEKKPRFHVEFCNHSAEGSWRIWTSDKRDWAAEIWGIVPNARQLAEELCERLNREAK